MSPQSLARFPAGADLARPAGSTRTLVANDHTPTLDAQKIEQFLRTELLSRRLESVAQPIQRPAYLSFNFPIEFRHGYRSMFGLLDPRQTAIEELGLDKETVDSTERFYFRDRRPAGSSARSTNVGLGATAVLVASGQRRFDSIQEQAQRLMSGVTVIDHPLMADLFSTAPLTSRISSHTLPRLFGGFSFAPGSASRAPWHDQKGPRFGDARFVLPKIALRCFDGCRFGVLVVTLDLARGRRAAGEVELRQRTQTIQRVLDVVARSPANPSPPIQKPEDRLSNIGIDRCPGTGAAFQAQAATLVEQAITRVQQGAFDKVVVARHRDLSLESSYQLTSLVQRLDQVTEGGSAFLLSTGDAVFLGAPPERLVSVQGGRVETEAVAGSRPRPDRTAASPELGPLAVGFRPGEKDLREHQSVAEHVTQALRPCCIGGVVEAGAPTVRAHPALFHLETAISATLRPGIHVLDLVARLHPTPAVCGAPFADALAHLETTEDQPRGWYAAPIGWFDGEGNGEFAVALRSAVLRDGNARLFAGAGIVSGSEPVKEAQEIARKMLPMARVLEPYLDIGATESRPLQWNRARPAGADPVDLRGRPEKSPSTRNRAIQNQTIENRLQRVLSLVGLFS